MTHQDVEKVQEAVEGFASSGEPPWDALDEEIVVYDHDIVDAGDYRGHAGFIRWLEDWAAAWGEYALEAEEFLDAGERVVAFIVQKTVGHGSGVSLDRKDAMVLQLREGKIVRLDYYNNREQALQAAGLAGQT